MHISRLGGKLMPKASIAEIRTHILYIRKAITRVEEQVIDHNKKIDEIQKCTNGLSIEMKNHLKHHENIEKNRTAKVQLGRWRWGIALGIVGTILSTIALIASLAGII